LWWGGIVLFLLFFFFLEVKFVFAENEETECPPPPSCPSTQTWTEYQCTKGCNGKIKGRECTQWWTLESIPGNPCPNYHCQSHLTCEEWKEIKTCHPWQECEPQGEILKNTLPVCVCSGKCLETPKNPRYYDNPTYLDQPDKSKDPNNIFLPVKLDWDNVEGWYKPNYLTPLPDSITPIPPETAEDIPSPPLPPPPEPITPPSPIEGEISLAVPIYYQNYPPSAPWPEFNLSPTEKIKRWGCNLTSFAMILQYFGYQKTPLDVGKFVKENHLWRQGYGVSNAELFNKFKSELPSPSYTWKKFYDSRQILTELEKGRPVIAGFSNYVQKGYQHWIVIRGYTKNKEFIINDPIYSWHQKFGGKLSWRKFQQYQPLYFVSFEKLSVNSSKNSNFPSRNYLAQIQSKEKPEAPSSYVITIENTNRGIFTQILDNSEFIPPPCLLKPGTTHYWHVKACCNEDGTNCGKESTWKFHTALVPELVSPLDPDWNGPKKLKDASLPITLDWCDVEGAQSYSFVAYILKNNEEFCLPQLESNGKCKPYPINLLTRPGKEKLSNFEDSFLEFFTKDTTYKWAVKSCKDPINTTCSEYSQKWSFSTQKIPLLSPQIRYPPNDPEGKTPIGLPLTLKWGKEKGANSYVYEINPGNITGITRSTSAWFDYPTLHPNTLYKWRIKPCWDFEGKNCEEFSEFYYFKTTGAPPENFSADTTIIPVKLSWERVSGADSYKYEVATDPNFQHLIISNSTERTNIIINYPDIKQETKYWWRVKTCAHPHGEICGKWSKTQTFQTFKLKAPKNLQPKNNSQLSPPEFPSFSWKETKGAKYYQFKIKYTKADPQEQQEKCSSLVGKEITKIIPLTSVFYPLECKGEYQWQVRGCLDEKCDSDSGGKWSPVFHLTFKAEKAPPEMKGGFIPCGQKYYNPDTPWDETEKCQPKHLFILLYIILNFLLWRVIPLILVLLTLATGIIFYLSFGASNTLAQIKSLWKAIGIGLGVIFFGWLFVDIILKILGYKVGIFG
ncbi:MAG TPA: hypothetical protein ENG13_02690, partial [bacterium]|nr:hypothetical protein [bacterium]HEX67955.1 hypothetical protein [bacterium]